MTTPDLQDQQNLLDDIVPLLIGLCAKGRQHDQAGRNAYGNALLSIITPFVGTNPALAAHWLAALHRQSPLTKPVAVARLMEEALGHTARVNPKQGMILSAAIMGQTRPGSVLGGLLLGNFRKAFDAALLHDQELQSVPAFALRAAQQVDDFRSDTLKSLIRQRSREAAIRIHLGPKA